MELWVWVLLFAAVIKIPIAALMLWIPFHNDQAAESADVPDSSDEDGGSKALPGGPLDPHPHVPRPRGPRRGPHGSPSPPSPPRVRTPVRTRPQPVRVSH